MITTPQSLATRLASTPMLTKDVAVTPAPIRTHLASEFRLEDLVAAKGASSVSVCIPARNEESTVGAIVEAHTKRMEARWVNRIVMCISDFVTTQA